MFKLTALSAFFASLVMLLIPEFYRVFEVFLFIMIMFLLVLHSLVYRDGTVRNDKKSGADSIGADCSGSSSSSLMAGGLVTTAFSDSHDAGVFSEYGDSAGLVHSDSGLGQMDINPANGLPMVGGVDIMGNPYGTTSYDIAGINSFDSSGGFDTTMFDTDSFGSSSFDSDSFGSSGFDSW